MNNVVSIIPGLKRRRFFSFSNEVYTLVVFKDKTVFARLTSQILNEIVLKAKEKAKSEGKGFFGRWGAQISSSLNYAKRYEDMSFDGIKNESEGNFSVDNDTITKVRVRMNSYDESAKNFYYVDIFVSGVKHKFTARQNPIEGLKRAYGSRVN